MTRSLTCAKASPRNSSRWHPLSQAQYLETAHLLPGYILSSQGDRVAMAHAVECRFPFLDHRVVEFAARIPPKLKIRGLREKHILRESARTLLPRAINNRAKQPYRSPDSLSFLGSNQPDYVDACLSASELAANGWFDSRAVDKLVRKCRTQAPAGFRDNMAFVGILSTQLWHREFVCGKSLVPPVSPALVAEERIPAVTAEIETQVRSLIEDNFLFREDRTSLSDTESLIDAGLIDSTGILELVAFLEERFKIEIADADLVPENFDSINRIVAYVARVLATAPSAS